MDQAYQEALRKRDDLKRQLSEIEEFLRLWQRVFGTEGEQSSPPNLLPTPPKMRVGLGANHPKRSPTRSRVATIARKVILTKGAPMTRGELVAAFEARGEPIAGSDPSRNMGTIMWRLRDSFINIDGHGYWPKDVPLNSPELRDMQENNQKGVSRQNS